MCTKRRTGVYPHACAHVCRHACMLVCLHVCIHAFMCVCVFMVQQGHSGPLSVRGGECVDGVSHGPVQAWGLCLYQHPGSVGLGSVWCPEAQPSRQSATPGMQPASRVSPLRHLPEASCRFLLKPTGRLPDPQPRLYPRTQTGAPRAGRCSLEYLHL